MVVKKYKNELIRQAHNWLAVAVYEAAKIENIHFTFPETDEIIKNEYLVADKYKESAYGVDVIVNLKHAYSASLDLANLENYKFDYKDLLYLHRIVGQSIIHNNGNFRNLEVRIKGTSYKPPYPPTPEIWKEKVDSLLSKNWNKADVLDLYVDIMKQQYFNDGNKRTALVFANTLLLSKELGFIEIKDDCTATFFQKLLDCYDNKISKKQFIDYLDKEYVISQFDPHYQNEGIKMNKAESFSEHLKNKGYKN